MDLIASRFSIELGMGGLASPPSRGAGRALRQSNIRRRWHVNSTFPCSCLMRPVTALRESKKPSEPVPRRTAAGSTFVLGGNPYFRNDFLPAKPIEKLSAFIYGGEPPILNKLHDCHGREKFAKFRWFGRALAWCLIMIIAIRCDGLGLWL